ncbi:Serine/threonine-protein kinase PrkC [Aquisphaera giovannonii]|uniref:non-specific serine/threonine protein kinase n=1 Tax=Aquisphaera giovannonii TaxID=406548 RepID=A0A5B9W8C7_9BACT|nr:protein kinase [Aquisphaera giovannonii]QEH36399.1 Serine/threonine-protein kinase PrkC [Aquisphaera giovannonii]
MTSSAESADPGVDPLDSLAEEFAARYRRGERPTMGEYEERFPELAPQIRLLFPALVELEKAGPAAQAAGPPAPGRIGEFRLLRRAGVGGMGVVYEASQETLGRRVALKVLPQRAFGASRERFLREARTAARLHHTNIVPVFSVGEAEGVQYYAMQFIDGPTLAQVLDVSRVRRVGADDPFASTRSISTGGEPTPPGPAKAEGPSEPTHDALKWADPDGRRTPQAFRDLARLTSRVASALDYAHGQGVLHRDIKPSNILLDAQGMPWVVDFGLAKSADDDDLTRTGDLVGTLRYMAPERFRGRADARSDIYSLGATLYEVLTLRPAFGGADRVALIDAICRARPPRPRAIDPAIPRDLETICLKAMAREPGDRYPTAADLAADLDSFLADQPIRARRAGPVERARRWWRRDPAEAALAIAVGVLLAALGAGTSGFALWAESAREHAVTLGRQATDAERERTRQLARSLADRARAGRTSRRPGQRFESLAAIREAAALGRQTGEPPAFFDDLRNQAVASMALPDIRYGRPAGWGLGPRMSYRFDPSMRTIALAGIDGRVRVSHAEGGDLAALESYPGDQFLRLDAGGRVLAARSASGGLRAWDLRDGTPAQLLDRAAAVVAHDVRPDGQEVASAAADGMITLIRARDRVPAVSWRAEQPPRDLAYSPDGRSLAAGLLGGVAVFDAATGRRRALLRGAEAVTSIAWHPRGEHIAAGDEHGWITTWDVRRGESFRSGSAHSGGVQVAFAPDGSTVSSAAWDGLWRLHDVAGGQHRLVAGLIGGQELGLRGVLAAGESVETMGFAEYVTGVECRTLLPAGERSASANAVAVDPTGRLLAVARTEWAGLWDLADGRLVAELRVPCSRVAFTRRGELITNGRDGLFRWRPSIGRDGSLALPGPVRLADLEPGGGHALAASLDGRFVAAAMAAGTVVIEVDRPGRLTWPGPQADVRNLALSPDGRFVALASWHGGQGVGVYEAATGRPLVSFPAAERTAAEFSPDGQWLLVGTESGRRLYRVGDWSPGAVVGGVASGFSGDGRLLATATAEGVVRLLRPDDGREVVRLEPPDLERVYNVAFSADGTRLAVSCASDRWVYCWDLRAIRRQLGEMGLDWDAPPLPAEGPVRPLPVTLLDPPPGPLAEWIGEEVRARLRLLVGGPSAELYHRLAAASIRRRAFDRALDYLDRAVALRPGWAEAHCERGRLLLRHRRDAAAALGAFGRAAEIDPTWWRARLGRAESRILDGHAREALVDLKGLAAERPWDNATNTLMAAAMVEAGRPREALPILDAVLRGVPSNIVARHWRAMARRATGDDAGALDDEPGGRGALDCNALAWLICTGRIEFRSLELALPQARRAVALDPGQAAYHNTLGLTLFRLGQYAEATTELLESLRLGRGATDGFDLYPLALVRRRSGDPLGGWPEFLRALVWHARGAGSLDSTQRDELNDLLIEAFDGMSRPAPRR